MTVTITDIKFFKNKTAGNMLGSGTVKFSDPFGIKVSIWNGKNGPSVLWPAKKGQDAEGKDKYYEDIFWDDIEDKKEASLEVIRQWNVFAGTAKNTKTPAPTNSKNTAGPKNTARRTVEDLDF